MLDLSNKYQFSYKFRIKDGLEENDDLPIDIPKQHCQVLNNHISGHLN